MYRERAGRTGRRQVHQQQIPDEEKGFGAANRPQWTMYDAQNCQTVAPKTQPQQEKRETRNSSGKKKVKYVNLYSDQGKNIAVVKLPGRHECDCQATEHDLVNNCIKCGRIVCSQEGSGPCFFCHALVCTAEEQKVFDEGGRKAEELKRKLVLLPMPTAKQQDSNTGKTTSVTSHSKQQPEVNKGMEEAKAARDRLLNYQDNSARRTTVLDDQSDYYETGNNPWISQEEKKKLRDREEQLRAIKHAPRSQQKLTFDFAGRRVIEDQSLVDEVYNPNDQVLRDIYTTESSASTIGTIARDLHATDGFKPTYETTELAVSTSEMKPKSSLGRHKETTRLQDSNLHDMVDQGKCLSMHQPYASLLVLGIKQHEGRTWYTSHRGLLWIASTAKPPTSEEITNLQSFYQHYYADNVPANFPNQYPTSRLLGCVNIVDCLSQEQYREQFPNGESESPYVCICSAPRRLSTLIPIRGFHKIYSLEPAIHQAAKRMLI